MFDRSNYKLHNLSTETTLAYYIGQPYFGNINGVNNSHINSIKWHQNYSLKFHISMHILQIELQLHRFMIFFNKASWNYFIDQVEVFIDNNKVNMTIYKRYTRKGETYKIWSSPKATPSSIQTGTTWVHQRKIRDWSLLLN